jgi:imidazolonepropionase
MRFDTIWLDARLATLTPDRPGLGIVERGAIAAKDGRIAFAGPMAELLGDGMRSIGWCSTAAG